MTINEKYKQGSRLYPDGGILIRGKLIKNFSILYKKFNLEDLHNNYKKEIQKKCFKDKLMTRFISFIEPIIKHRQKNAMNKFKKEFPEVNLRLSCKLITIGILCVAIGKYIIFWKKFYKYAEKKLFKDHKKIYYLFTDSDIDVPDNVKLIHQENLGWANNNLYKYEYFLKSKDILSFCNYFFYRY